MRESSRWSVSYTHLDVYKRQGVERAKKQAEDADLILYVADSSRPLDESDEEILDLLKGRKALVLLNKSDLELSLIHIFAETGHTGGIADSKGLDQFIGEILTGNIENLHGWIFF